MQKCPLWTFASACCCLLLASCGGSREWQYHYKKGRTAQATRSGHAFAPRKAPKTVRKALSAGNHIVGKPYKYGGGHRSTWDSGYDCSGSVSHVLIGAGLLSAPRPSSGFRRYGKSGEGKWITVYSTKGHSFIEVAGLRFDTGWHSHGKGPHWTQKSRPLKHYTARHPPGM